MYYGTYVGFNCRCLVSVSICSLLTQLKESIFHRQIFLPIGLLWNLSMVGGPELQEEEVMEDVLYSQWKVPELIHIRMNTQKNCYCTDKLILTGLSFF